MFSAEVVRTQLVLGVVPQPSELAARMFRFVVLLEAAIGCLYFGGDDKSMRAWIKAPKIGTKDHDVERDTLVLWVVLNHAFFERIGKILAEPYF